MPQINTFGLKILLKKKKENLIKNPKIEILPFYANFYYLGIDMVLSGQCRQDSKFLETVTVATVRLETVRQ